MEVYIIQNLIDILFIMVTGYIFTDNSFRYQFFYFFRLRISPEAFLIASII